MWQFSRSDFEAFGEKSEIPIRRTECVAAADSAERCAEQEEVEKEPEKEPVSF